jgi:hypothetical protein
MNRYYEGENPPPGVQPVSHPDDQPSAAPSDKVAVAGLSGVATTVILFLVETLTKAEPPAAVSGAIVTLVAFAFAYFKREKGSLHP